MNCLQQNIQIQTKDTLNMLKLILTILKAMGIFKEM